MRFRPRGVADDCCCTSLADKVKWLMERIGGTVRKLIINGNEYTPDGDGTVTLDTSAFVVVDDALDPDSNNPIANSAVAAAVAELQDKNTLQDTAITDNAEDIADLQTAGVGMAGRIAANAEDIAMLEGAMAGMVADNVYTRSVAQGAADTANGLADRITDLETNDQVQTDQIGQLIVADQASAKLAGNNAFTGNNSFAVNPKAAAPASGAVDTSVVNANWASQTGDDAPNNLIHKSGIETRTSKLNIKVGNNSSLDLERTGNGSIIECRALEYDATQHEVIQYLPAPFILHDKNGLTYAQLRFTQATNGAVNAYLRVRNADGTNKDIFLGGGDP